MRRLAPLLCLALAACAAERPPRDPWPGTADGSVSRHGDYLMVSGVGKPDPKAGAQTQRRSTSRDAAILEARARLLDYLQRIMIAGGVSVGERATEDEGWRKKLEAATTGIEVVDTKWDDQDTAAVVLRVEKESVARALGLEP